MEQVGQLETGRWNQHPRKKRNPLMWAGLGWGIYSNKKQIDKIKDNIQKLQNQNLLQE